MKHKSKYSQKVKGRNQIYGPGCCAHKNSVNHQQRAVNELLVAQYTPFSKHDEKQHERRLPRLVAEIKEKKHEITS